MLPYWFSAMTMKAVGKAAMEMVLEVDRQFAAAACVLPDAGAGAAGRGPPGHSALRSPQHMMAGHGETPYQRGWGWREAE